MFLSEVIRLFHHTLFSGQTRYLNMKMNKLLTHPLICWNATRGTGGLRRGNQLMLGNALAEWIYFPISAAMLPMMSHRLVWTNFVYYILAIRPFLSLSVNLTSHFRTLLISNNYRYQTHARNITRFYLLIPKYLTIQLTKLQIDILNLSTTLRHCRKIPTIL